MGPAPLLSPDEAAYDQDLAQRALVQMLEELDHDPGAQDESLIIEDILHLLLIL